MTSLSPEARARLEEALGASVVHVERLAGGACQDNFVLASRAADGTEKRWVLRSDARTSLPGSIDRSRELRVMRAAHAAGVRTPEPFAHFPELFAPKTSAYLVPFFSGEAIGRKIVKGPELASARDKLATELAVELAKIHTVTRAKEPDLFPPSEHEATPAVARIVGMRTSLDGLSRKRPALEWLLRWLEDHAPAEPGPPVLVHGDFRTGNFLVEPSGLSAVLDWEFAHFGSPYEDLTWISVRDWRFGQLGLPIGGFSKRAPFYEAYTAASGRVLDPVLLHYWEVLGNVGWALGAAHQTERYTHGGEDDLELLAIGRRASEMEWEAMRLVEKGTL
jgi:aminoglycoside phosphotransferase (APT) family kinase protein